MIITKTEPFTNQEVEKLKEHFDPYIKTVIDVEKEVCFSGASEHIRRLAIAGLVLKRNQGVAVRHKLLPSGRSILKFLRTLE